MSVIVEIAEAAKNELNGHAFGQHFQAVRAYVPVYELADMKTLHVTVVPKGMEMEGAARTLVQHDYQIDVAVQKKFEKEGTVEIDPLMTLVEQIIDFFRLRRLKAVANAMCVKAVNEPVYSAEHMEQFRQFTSVLTLTFRVLR